MITLQHYVIRQQRTTETDSGRRRWESQRLEHWISRSPLLWGTGAVMNHQYRCMPVCLIQFRASTWQMFGVNTTATSPICYPLPTWCSANATLWWWIYTAWQDHLLVVHHAFAHFKGVTLRQNPKHIRLYHIKQKLVGPRPLNRKGLQYWLEFKKPSMTPLSFIPL